ncbi:MAG: hypothetical protein Kow0075_05630 [Salibacteraceae bacterium]
MFANAQRHSFIQYSVKEGLAQSQVRDILQTTDGYLWIATVGGFSRFDGLEFRTFNKSNGLMNNLVTSLAELKDGTLAIACKGGVVLMKNDQFLPIAFPPEFSETIVFDMIEWEGALYMATNGNGIFRLEDDTTISRIEFGTSRHNFIRAVAAHQNALYIGTRRGLLRWTPAGHEILIDTISVNEISVREDEMWIATANDGVYRVDGNDTIRYTVAHGLGSMYQKDLAFDRSGNLWCISKNDIVRFNRHTSRFIPVLPLDPSKAANLEVIYSDLEHNMWIGTSGNGILKYTGDAFETYTINDGFAGDVVMNIEQGVNGDYFFATYGFGVIRWNGKLMEHITYSTHGLLNNTVWSLERVNRNQIWIGTSGGINIYENGEIRDFELNDSLPFKRTSVIFQSSDSCVWIGNRDGLLVVKNGRIVTPKRLRRLKIKEIKSFAEHDGLIWMSSASGVYAYPIDGNGEVLHIDQTNGLREDYVSCLTVDGYGHVWLGSEAGLTQLDPESLHTRHFDLSDKLSANIVNFVLTEGKKRVWAGTDNGLFSLNLNLLNEEDSILIKSYNEHDGLVGQECNQNAAYADNQGKLWFGTNGGLMRFDPDKSNELQSDLFFVKLNEVLVNFEPLENWPAASTVALKHNNNRLTFGYNAIHYRNPEKITYSYRLNGNESRWSPPVKERSVTYANLAPGSYNFEVRAKLENGRWSKQSASFRFTIMKPYYQTWWFILINIIVLFTLVYLGFRYRQQQIIRKRQLEEVQNKAKILGLERQTLNAHMNRHFIFNALNSIQYYINTNDRKLANDYLTKFAVLVRKNLDSAQVEYISLEEELDRLQLYLQLEQMRFKNRFDYQIRLSDNIKPKSVRVPSMILQPYTENSIMHGILPSQRKGKILIDIKLENSDLIIEIFDNGIGVETSMQRKRGNGPTAHVSNGMKITRQRMDLLRKITRKNYQIKGPEQISEGDKVVGTKVVIIIPQEAWVNAENEQTARFN